MQIIHKIDDFLFIIFPKIKMGGGNSLIISELENYYRCGPFKPIVTIDNEWVTIQIDTPTIISQEADYRKTVALCEKGKYTEAKPILKNLIDKNPTNSEYHRIMGQILSDEGDQEEAINYLIDALRWDSKNGWALLMMGNIFARYKNDVATALTYYDQALVANTQDHISLTNIGYLLLQDEKLEEAKKYLWEAIKINNQYPNTHFTLALIAEKEQDLNSAFYSTIQTIQLFLQMPVAAREKDELYQNAVKHAFTIANKIIATDEGKKIFRAFRQQLEKDGGTAVDIIADADITTAAKIEFAENYNTDQHIVRFKPQYPAVAHLIMHELTHLLFVIAARKEGLNQLFVATQQHKAIFIKSIEANLSHLKKLGLDKAGIDRYCNSIFTGLNSQIYNAPIDLFIEDFLYNEYAELRPFQFISMHALLLEAIQAVTDKKIVELTAKEIVSKSKIYNLVNALQFKALFGLDFTSDFNANPAELKQAMAFYEEYQQYKEDKQPAEEYELLQHWAEDLQLDKNFELISETEYRTKRTDIDNLLNSIEQDPLEAATPDPFKERQMDKFQQSQESIGLNMAVVLFMVDALQYFQTQPAATIKKIAIEIAMQGIEGYRPGKKDYTIPSIPNQLFTGYKILSYYYVSWAIAMPGEVDKLGLDYGKEYEMAVQMHKNN